jgi:hypothetical protein
MTEGGGVTGASFARALEGQQRAALADPVADLDQELAHRARLGRRDLHRGLVALQRDERVVYLHRVAGPDMQLDDRDVLEVADVGDLDLARRHLTSLLIRRP